MDTKVKGIVIKLIDYKDADRLAQIFSLEEGIITARFSGVKKEKSKFKAVAQAFVFADFVLSVKGEHRTITSAEIIDPFSKLLSDYARTMAGYVVLDIIRRILPEGKSEQDIFLLTLTTLKNLEEKDVNFVLIDFIIKFIKLSGMGLEFPEVKYAYLDPLTGNFTAERTKNSVEIDKKVYSLIKSIFLKEKHEISKDLASSTSLESEIVENTAGLDAKTATDSVNSTTIKQALRLMRNILFLKFGVDIKAFDYLS